MSKNNNFTFQNVVRRLEEFWSKQGCVILQPYDMEIGAGTFHPDTFLRALGPEPWYCAHVQASRRPSDGRYGEHPNRNQKFFQFQVVLKPSPKEIQELYLKSLEYIGIDTAKNDIRFVEDNWESPTLGAWGLGWEVWLNGMEVTQFTYFQQVGGISCELVAGELAYGIERIIMHLQNVDHFKDMIWTNGKFGPVTYSDIFFQNEQECSAYNFDIANTEKLKSSFEDVEVECDNLLNENLSIPAYEMVLKASHLFNLMDARNAISVSLRQNYLLRVRTMARKVAESYLKKREELGFPLIKN